MRKILNNRIILVLFFMHAALKSIAGTALINNLSDMAFTSLNPVTALSSKENVCVYSNSLLGGVYTRDPSKC